MIDKFFMQAATLSRLRNGLLGPHLPEVAPLIGAGIRELAFGSICGLPTILELGFWNIRSRFPISTMP